jgi:hypothetical protein
MRFKAEALETPVFNTTIIRLSPVGSASILALRLGANLSRLGCVTLTEGTALDIGMKAVKLSSIVAIAIIDTIFLFKSNTLEFFLFTPFSALALSSL